MKFTVVRTDLQRLLKAVVSFRRRVDTLTLSACAAHVFADCDGDVAGIEALILADGAITLPSAGKFREVLNTYKGRRFLNFGVFHHLMPAMPNWTFLSPCVCQP